LNLTPKRFTMLFDAGYMIEAQLMTWWDEVIGPVFIYVFVKTEDISPTVNFDLRRHKGKNKK